MVWYLYAILNLNSPTIPNSIRMAAILDSCVLDQFWNGWDHSYITPYKVAKYHHTTSGSDKDLRLV